MSFIVSLITLNYDLLVIQNCVKNVQNYIMNNINDRRPFPLHEQSWYRTALLIKNTKTDII